MEEDSFDKFLGELDREETRITVRMEMRRFKKPVTIVEGIDQKNNDLERIAKSLKSRLAAGGSVKDGLILLQGDHRKRVAESLPEFGFRKDSIEVQ